MIQDLNYLVNLLTLVLIAVNWRDYASLPKRDQFIWRYIIVLALASFGSVTYHDNFGYWHALSQWSQKHSPMTFFLVWQWDRLRGPKILYILGIFVISLLLQIYANNTPTRVVESIFLGILAIRVGAEPVWRGRMRWPDLLQFGIGTIWAQLCFTPFIDKMPFAWDRWFYLSWQLFVAFMCSLELFFLGYYFILRKTKPVP